MVAVSFMFSICTLSSYSPESERAAWRTKNTVSKSLVCTCTREVSTGAPPLVHTTCGRGFPWGRGRSAERSAWASHWPLTSPLPACPPPHSAYLEGDDEVELLPHFADVSLAEMARQPDLGWL